MIQRVSLSVLAVLCLSGVLLADSCKVQVSYPAPVQAAQPYAAQAQKKEAAQVQQKEELVFNRFLAVQLLEVPTYSAVYVPAPAVYQAPAVQAQQSNELREVLEVLKSFDARLRRLEGAAPPVLVPPAPQIPPMSKIPEGASRAKPVAQTLLVTRCAVCHEATVAGDKSGGIVLFKGDPPVLTAADRWRQKMATAIEKGQMPEMGSAYTLTADEKVVLVDYLRSMR